jgi:putative transposase
MILMQRRSIRLKGYDYTQPGAYFVTVVTDGRVNLFGAVVDGKMKVNQFGQIIAQTCNWLQIQYPYVKMDPFIIMPDHLHGIFWINEIGE